MNKYRVISTFALAIFISLIPNIALASDLPVLTWERGKEQNVVLGNVDNSANLKVVLANRNSTILTFSKSRVNAKGFVVYSASIPSTIPTGTYFVETANFQGKSNAVVAAVDIVSTKNFDIGQVPSNLFLEIGFFTFLISTLLVTKRLDRFEIETNNLDLSNRSQSPRNQSPNLINRLNKLYSRFQVRSSRGSQDQSFLQTIVDTNDQTLRGIAGYLPYLIMLITCGVVIGFSFLSHKIGDPIPYWAVLILLILSSIHFYSAIVGSFTFVAINLFIKDIHSLRDLIFLILQVTSMTLIGIIGTIYFQLARHDSLQRFYSKKQSTNLNLARLFSSATASFFFVAMTILAQSLSQIQSASQDFIFYKGFIVFLVTLFLNNNVAEFVHSLKKSPLRKVKIGLQIENQQRTHNSLYASLSAFICLLIFFWTNEIVHVFYLTLLFIVILLVASYGNSVARKFGMSFRIHHEAARSIYTIPTTFSILASIEVFIFKNLPVVTFEKAKLAVYFGFLPLVVCAIIVSLSHSEERRSEQ